MPRSSLRAALMLTGDQRAELERISRLRTGEARMVERAQILLRYAAGDSVSLIARSLKTNRPKVERCLNKALQLGVTAALGDLPGRGRKATITDEARAWVLDLACRKPKELGYSYELWTTALLSEHLRRNAKESGIPRWLRSAEGPSPSYSPRRPSDRTRSTTTSSAGIRRSKRKRLKFSASTERSNSCVTRPPTNSRWSPS